MLATILKSKVATEVSIRIMDTFVKMRHYINYNIDFLPHRFLLLEDKVDDNTKRIAGYYDSEFYNCDVVKYSIDVRNALESYRDIYEPFASIKAR